MGDAQPGSAARYFFKRQSGAENLAAKLKEKKTAPEIPLSSFEFEQSGNTVRVIDGDGSIYSGRTLSSAETRERLGEFNSSDKAIQAEMQPRGKPTNAE